jgi:hypothetical protein
MAKNLNLLDSNVIKQIVTELDNGEERDRKKSSFDNWQIYSGNQDPYVQESIKQRRPRSWKSYNISDISVSSMVTQKKSKSYKQQPLRFVEKENENKNERLAEIYKEANAIRQMPFFDTVTNLHKYALMWVNYLVDEDQQSGKYHFTTLQPFEFSVVRSKQDGELLAVILNHPHRDITAGAGQGDGLDGLLAESQADSSAESRIYRMWSKDNYVVIKIEENELMTASGAKIEKSITYLPNPDNPSNINILGRIPFVYVSTELAIDYPTPSPLGSQSTRFGVMMSELITSADLQGTSTLTFKYPSHMQGQFDKISTGLTDVIELPQSSNDEDAPTEADYISPSPDLANQKDAYMSYLEGVLSQHGINVGQAMAKDVEASSSGIALAIKNANIDDIISANQQIFVQAEKEMFEIVKAWESWLGSTVFDDEDELQITFKKPKVLISDKEVLDNIKMRIDMGLMQKHEALMELDPNLSEQEAKDKLEEIEKEKQSNMIKFMGGFNGQVSEADEENQTRPFRNTPQQ